MALALPPWHVVPAVLVLILLDRSPLRWWGVWLFAFGYHIVGLNWIATAFYAEAERFGALAIPGVIALSAILATITSLAILGSARLIGREGWARSVSIAGGWTLAEMLRGPWGTQFPWNPTSLFWSVSDASMQPIAWLGSEALGFVTLLAVMASGKAWQGRHAMPAVAAIALIAGLVILGHWRLPQPTPPAQGQPLLHLVQANIAQHHKWDQDKRREWFFRHVELSKSAEGPPDILIWPESSVPYSIDNTADARTYIVQSLGEDGVALVGSDFVDREQEPILLHNSVYALNSAGDILDRYDKVQLVPFGEFLPFRSLLAPIGLEALAVGSVDFTSGAARRSLNLPGLPSPSPFVCFEAVFPAMATPVGEEPGWLLNLTNDAWFGMSAGPYQHMNMARMRSVETGLPLVRAANTGISVVTDGYGRVQSVLPLGEGGTIRQRLPAPLAERPWIGRHPAISWALYLLLFAISGFLARMYGSNRTVIHP